MRAHKNKLAWLGGGGWLLSSGLILILILFLHAAFTLTTLAGLSARGGDGGAGWRTKPSKNLAGTHARALCPPLIGLRGGLELLNRELLGFVQHRLHRS